MTSLTLRPYQAAAIDNLFEYFQNFDGNPVLTLPTGTGKSIIIAGFCQRALSLYPGQKILIAVHVKELIEGNYNELLTAWPEAPAGIYSSSVGRRDIAPITFVGIQTVANKALQFGKVDLLIIDECHLVGNDNNSQYVKFIQDLMYLNPHLKIIGLSATPYRLGMGMITEGGIFTDISLDMTTRQAFTRFIAEGWMCPLIAKRTENELDVSEVHKSGGEYILKELQEAVDKSPITAAALEETLRCSTNRNHWLVFAAGLKHAAHISEMLNLMGVPTAVINGELPMQEREEILRKYKAGEYKAVVNNNVLTTGFNFPAIDLIVMLRPTYSPGLWVQMLGRGTRPFLNKPNCLVLDFAGNTRRLGPINDPVIPHKLRKGRGDHPAPVRICPQCNCYSHASARICENCGYEFPVVIKIAPLSSSQNVVADLPQIVDFPVTNLSYKLHEKVDKPPSMCVTYMSGLRRFREWVCLEHKGYAQYRAHQWWRERSTSPCPQTIREALIAASTLKQPEIIRVWINTPNPNNPEVMSYVFKDTE